MKISYAIIEGFRAFVERTRIDLNADVVILQGPNGVGKTSLLDAILWALTGKIDRFQKRGTPVSLYSKEGIAKVELGVLIDQGEMLVARATDGDRTTLRITLNDEEYEGLQAEKKLAEELGSSAVPVGLDAISSILTRGIYLQQDLVRQLIESDTPEDRFRLISDVMGAGVVLDLQTALERSRNQWSRNLTSLRKEQLDPLLQQDRVIIEQVRRFDSQSNLVPVAQGDYKQFFERVLEVMGSNLLAHSAAPEDSPSLDRLLRLIAAERDQVERDQASTRALLEEAQDLSAHEQDDRRVQSLSQSAQALRGELDQANALVLAKRQEIALVRAQQIEDRNRSSRLSTMAQIALTELNDVCPVCEQSHDSEKTKAHLQDLIARAERVIDVKAVDDDLLNHEVHRDQLAGTLDALQAGLANAVRESQEYNVRYLTLTERLAALGLGIGGDLRRVLSERIQQLESKQKQLNQLSAEGESLTLGVVRVAEQRRHGQLLEERGRLSAKIASLTKEVEKAENTHKLAGRIIDALRQASLEITRQQILAIEPLFQRIYGRIDPHPTFSVPHLITTLIRGRGHLMAGLEDPGHNTSVDDVLPILSSSQLNSFAASLFLSINLSLMPLNLRLVMLDDPLQSLDSINLLGLVDVLRRCREHRQMIVSTHEARLLGLLQRKLRPVQIGERMITIVFEGWTRNGPAIKMIDSHFSSQGTKVLAA